MVPLEKRAHSYAHGGFMGAAISLVADPVWEDILLEGEGSKVQQHVADLVGAEVARKELLVLMNMLENSPVLCAYGLVRCDVLLVRQRLVCFMHCACTHKLHVMLLHTVP